ncbi:MAG: sulfatase [Acidobacteriota bacterium]
MVVPQSLASQRCIRLLALALLLTVSGGCRKEGQLPVRYDFVEAFPLVELVPETRLIDLGTPPARPHLLDGWSSEDHNRPQETSFVWGSGDRSSVRFTVLTPRAMALRVSARPYDPTVDSSHPVSKDFPSRVVTVQINEKTVGDLRLRPGFHEYLLQIPTFAQLHGENLLVFRYSLDPPTAIPFGADNPRELTVAWDTIRFQKRSHGKPHVDAEAPKGSLILPQMSRIDYFPLVPPGAVLTLAGVEPWGKDAGDIDFSLRVEFQAAGSDKVVTHYLRPGSYGEPREWPLAVDSEKPVRVSFTVVGGHRLVGKKGLELLHPVLRWRGKVQSLEGELEAVGGQSPTLQEVRDRRPNIIIYLIDALRAGHLGIYGYPRPVSPHIDALAEDSLLLLRARAQSSWTRSAVASIFTGLYAQSHGVLGRDDALPASATTLAGLLQQDGYQTVGFTTNGNVSRAFGFQVGFDRYVSLGEQQTREIHQLSDRLNQRVFEWLEGRTNDRPFFLYMHATDPHEPYTPRSPFRERFAPSLKYPQIYRPLDAARALQRDPSINPDDLAHQLVDLYDAEIAFNDSQFGKFVQRLKRLGLYEDAMIVLVADHGEEFLDHGGWAHGKMLYGEQLNIPLIIKFPGQWAAGTRSEALSQQIDLLPTILSYLGDKIPAQVQGSSLLPLVASPREALHSWVLAQLELDGRKLESIITKDSKLIRYLPAPRTGYRIEFYGLAADPLEQRDMATSEVVSTGYLLTMLNASNLSYRRLLTTQLGTPGEELLDRLRALGYVR